MAVCSTKEGLTPTSFYACSFQNQIGYHDFEGVTVRPEEGVRLLENLGDKRVLMLRNHGPVVLGKTIEQMFVTMWSLQRACEIQVATHAAGTPIHVPEEVVQVHQRDLAVMQGQGGAGLFDFGAWMRKAERIDPSFKE
jgi:ribulose-5-phosphate 4-epimerase/fuculose-1-phosphate aldolase